MELNQWFPWTVFSHRNISTCEMKVKLHVLLKIKVVANFRSKVKLDRPLSVLGQSAHCLQLCLASSGRRSSGSLRSTLLTGVAAGASSLGSCAEA